MVYPIEKPGIKTKILPGQQTHPWQKFYPCYASGVIT